MENPMSEKNVFDSLNFNPENLKTLKDNSHEIQNSMQEIQKKLLAIAVEGQAGIDNFTVKITLNGRHEATQVVIDPNLLQQPAQVLCDLVAAAITDAAHKTEMAVQNEMMKLFQGAKA